jgi:hypothetical protein
MQKNIKESFDASVEVIEKSLTRLNKTFTERVVQKIKYLEYCPYFTS